MEPFMFVFGWCCCYAVLLWNSPKQNLNFWVTFSFKSKCWTVYRPTALSLSSFLFCVTQSQPSHEGSCLSSKSYIPKSEAMLLCHHSLSPSHMQSAHKHILAGWLWAQLEDPSWPLVAWIWLHSLRWHAGPNLWCGRLRLNLAHRSTTHLALHASHEWLSVPPSVCVCVCVQITGVWRTCTGSWCVSMLKPWWLSRAEPPILPQRRAVLTSSLTTSCWPGIHPSMKKAGGDFRYFLLFNESNILAFSGGRSMPILYLSKSTNTTLWKYSWVKVTVFKTFT